MGDVFKMITGLLLAKKKYKLPIREQKACSILCVFQHGFDYVDNVEALEMQKSNMIH